MFWLPIASIYASLLTQVTAQSYTLADTYNGDNFFSKVNFYTGPDQGNGWADFQNESQARAKGLIRSTSRSAILAVEASSITPWDSRGRPSVRVETKATYNRGLYVFDIQHMPGNACGIWPSFWSSGTGDWPQGGEIDIVENVNLATNNQYTLHTGNGACVIRAPTGNGKLKDSNCQTTTNGKITNTVGCTIVPTSQNNYGDAFNRNGGGVYVMQWTRTQLIFWFFPRTAIPATLRTTSPKIAQLGTPDAQFNGCDITARFRDQKFIFSTSFCGDWAAAPGLYKQSGCPITAPGEPEWVSCKQRVADSPKSFANAFWEINFIRIYKESAARRNG